MRCLLDTHILLWWIEDDPKLRADLRATIADPANEVVVSAATLWEAAIKRALGKLRFETPVLLGRLEPMVASTFCRSRRTMRSPRAICRAITTIRSTACSSPRRSPRA